MIRYIRDEAVLLTKPLPTIALIHPLPALLHGRESVVLAWRRCYYNATAQWKHNASKNSCASRHPFAKHGRPHPIAHSLRGLRSSLSGVPARQREMKLRASTMLCRVKAEIHAIESASVHQAHVPVNLGSEFGYAHFRGAWFLETFLGSSRESTHSCKNKYSR